MEMSSRRVLPRCISTSVSIAICTLMNLLLTIALLAELAWCQNVDPDILEQLGQIFTPPKVNVTTEPGNIWIPGYVPISTSTTEGSRSYVPKCAEGRNFEKRLCVTYEKCDGKTNTIVPNGTRTYSRIDVRLTRIFSLAMKSALTFALFVGHVWCQLNEDTLSELEDVFPKDPTVTPKCTGLCIPGFQTVPTSSTQSSIGYLEKCGEGKTLGKRLCVNYEYCDGRTDTIVQNGLTAGFGIINIRFGENRCDHPLEVCCKIPEGGLAPDFDPQSKPPTTTPSPEVSSSPAFAPSYCGIRNENGIDFKITGNKDNEAEYGEFPWMVALINKDYNPAPGENFSFCGGSLISPSVVLTAAHCVYKYNANQVKVRAGEWDSKTTRERLPYQERNVVNIITHKDFVPAGVFNDFALLVLDNPMDKAEHVGTICLPEQEQVIVSKNCFVSGWGKNVFGSEGTYQDILKKIELPIVPIGSCQSALRKTRLGSGYILHDSFICAGGEKGKDACSGDGGSPLVCPDPSNPTRYLLTGMVAWGIGCGEQNVPGVYADVAKFRSWVDDQMQRLSLDTSPYVS